MGPERDINLILGSMGLWKMVYDSSYECGKLLPSVTHAADGMNSGCP